MRVLFLGNDYHPLSVSCLAALLDTRDCSVTAGIYDPKGKSTLATALTLLRTKGVRAVALRVRDVIISTTRVRMRRIGIGLRGYRSMHELALAFGCDTMEVGRINSSASLTRIRALEPDLIVVANFSQILKAPLLAIPPHGCINVHPSLLPAYRGPTPCYWVLKHRESVTGVTVHYVDTGIDSGDIIAQRTTPIAANDTELSLRQRTAALGGNALLSVIQCMKRGPVPRSPQDETKASYFSFPPPGESIL